MATDYGFNDVVEVTGASKSRLTHWLDKGLVESSVTPTTGRGVPRRFGRNDLIDVRVCVELTERFAFPLETLRWALVFVRFAVTQGHQVVWFRTSKVDRAHPFPMPVGMFSDEGWFWSGTFEHLMGNLERPEAERLPCFRGGLTGVLVDLVQIARGLPA